MIAPLAQVSSQTWRCRFDQCLEHQRATNGCHQNCNLPGSPRQVQCRGALGDSTNENEFICFFSGVSGLFPCYPIIPSSHHIGPPSVDSACNRLGTVACESANMYDTKTLHHVQWKLGKSQVFRSCSVASDFQVASATDQKHALLLVLKQEMNVIWNLYLWEWGCNLAVHSRPQAFPAASASHVGANRAQFWVRPAEAPNVGSEVWTVQPAAGIYNQYGLQTYDWLNIHGVFLLCADISNNIVVKRGYRRCWISSTWMTGTSRARPVSMHSWIQSTGCSLMTTSSWGTLQSWKCKLPWVTQGFLIFWHVSHCCTCLVVDQLKSTNCFDMGFNEPRLTILVFDATLWPSRAFASFYFQVFKGSGTNWKCYCSTGEALRRHDCGRGSSSLPNSLQWQSAVRCMVHASPVAQQYREMHSPEKSKVVGR